jgi:hypothetical protein
MDIPGSQMSKVREQLDVLRECCALNLDPDTIRPNDLMRVNYSVTCEYFGNVARALSAVNEICANHPEVVTGVEYQELKHGRMLIHEVLARLDQLMATVGPPK